MRPLDEQQARLVARLRAAHGAPVSFEQLRSEGIENPAQLCYELEVAGVHITRVHRQEGRGMGLSVGIRLEEPEDEQPAPEASESQRGSDQASPPSSRLQPRPIRSWALVAALALTAAVAVGTALVVTGHSHKPRASAAGGRARAQAAKPPSVVRHSTPRRTGAAEGRGVTPAPNPRTRGAQPVRPPVSPAGAAQLQLTGHQLLAQGRYAAARGELRAALAASGQSLDRCAEPSTQTCLTYAYALYDLGRALRLGGHPADGARILSERLRIDNQRPTVQHELQLALQQLGGAGPSGSPPRG
jgi:hypothetical protein